MSSQMTPEVEQKDATSHMSEYDAIKAASEFIDQYFQHVNRYYYNEPIWKYLQTVIFCEFVLKVWSKSMVKCWNGGLFRANNQKIKSNLKLAIKSRDSFWNYNYPFLIDSQNRKKYQRYIRIFVILRPGYMEPYLLNPQKQILEHFRHPLRNP